MEPIFQTHPIPQNVTNFEFHLVGDMTLKQFAYLASGVGFAFLVFTTLSTSQPIIAWPIIVISSLLGVAFAFLPIQERPLDHWVGAFFKAIFKPTSLKFSSKIIRSEDPLFSRRLNHYIKTYKYAAAKSHAILGNPNLLPTAMSTPNQAGTTPMQPGPSAPLKTQPLSPQKKQNFIDKFKAGQTAFVPLKTTGPLPEPSPPVQNIQPIPPPAREAPTPIPAQIATTPQPQPNPEPKSTTPADLKKTVDLAQEAQKTQAEIVKIESSLAQIKQQVAQPGVDPKSYVENFEELLTQLQLLNEKASKTAKELAEISQEPSKPTPTANLVKAKSIPTLKLTSFPNVISGIVTDSLGNYIEGAIVVAHDKQGLPVRALKSNKLGQFVAATPLPNGDYAIAVEKDDLVFDKVSIDLKNEVLPPILVAAKKLQQGLG